MVARIRIEKLENFQMLIELRKFLPTFDGRTTPLNQRIKTSSVFEICFCFRTQFIFALCGFKRD